MYISFCHTKSRCFVLGARQYRTRIVFLLPHLTLFKVSVPVFYLLRVNFEFIQDLLLCFWCLVLLVYIMARLREKT